MTKTLIGIHLAAAILLSASSCSSSRENMDENTDTNDISAEFAPIPPGAANIRCLVLNIENKEQGVVYYVRINEVAGYGSATPALPAGTELPLHSGATIENNAGEPLAVGDEVFVRIMYSQGMGDVEHWRLLRRIDQR